MKFPRFATAYKRDRLILSLLLCLAISVVVFGFFVFPRSTSFVSLPRYNAIDEVVTSTRRVIDTGPIETHRFVDPRASLGAWQVWGTETKAQCGLIKGAVVNHHILALDLLGRLFSRLAFCRPDIKHVIVLSPDHFARGKQMISTHDRSYVVAGQTIEPFHSAIQMATSSYAFVFEQPELFEQEHGIGALIPFIQRAWPHADVASFAVRSDLSRMHAEQFVTFLKTKLDRETILIISSDMSHYLSQDQALHNDELSRAALRKSDHEFFWKATDDYTDNGKSFWLALTALGMVSWQEQDHRLSTDYDGSRTNTTSYITGWWKK
jgi:AmmeMemoRadiSam system protein B